jgi:hypothetical protein
MTRMTSDINRDQLRFQNACRTGNGSRQNKKSFCGTQNGAASEQRKKDALTFRLFSMTKKCNKSESTVPYVIFNLGTGRPLVTRRSTEPSYRSHTVSIESIRTLF